MSHQSDEEILRNTEHVPVDEYSKMEINNEYVEKEVDYEDNHDNPFEEKSNSPATEKRMLIIASGYTQEDLRAFVAIYLKLKNYGWKVGLFTNEVYRKFLTSLDVDETTLFLTPGNPEDVYTNSALRQNMSSGKKMSQLKAIFDAECDLYFKTIPQVEHSVKQFSPTCIMSGIHSISECLALAQSTNVPVIIASSFPINETSTIPPVGTLNEPSSWPWVNKGLYYVLRSARWLSFQTPINRLRHSLGLQPQSELIIDGLPIINTFSSHIFPAPHDWPRATSTLGYWFCPDSNQKADNELELFLSSGEKPICFAFGPFPLFDVKKTVSHAIEALKKLERRGVFLMRKYSELDGFQWPETVYYATECPTDTLFAKSSLVVHHGSPGMCALALKYGLPSVIYPFAGDQSFWGMRFSALGIAPKKVIDLKDFSEENLIKQIQECDQNLTNKAKELSTKVIAEDGVSKACASIETLFNQNKGTGKKFQWQPDSKAKKCNSCSIEFTFFTRKHHCRYCGLIFCLDCLALRSIPNYAKEQMICRDCWDERTKVESQFEQTNMNWEELQSERGEKYYWNKRENTVTWSADQYNREKEGLKGPPKDSKVVNWSDEKPEGEEWEEYSTEKGEVYYYNKRTNATTWTNKKLEQVISKNPVLKKPPPPNPEENSEEGQQQETPQPASYDENEQTQQTEDTNDIQYSDL